MKREIMTSRMAATARVIAALKAAAPERRPRALLSASAVGFYGARTRPPGHPATQARTMQSRGVSDPDQPAIRANHNRTQLEQNCLPVQGRRPAPASTRTRAPDPTTLPRRALRIGLSNSPFAPSPAPCDFFRSFLQVPSRGRPAACPSAPAQPGPDPHRRPTAAAALTPPGPALFLRRCASAGRLRRRKPGPSAPAWSSCASASSSTAAGAPSPRWRRSSRRAIIGRGGFPSGRGRGIHYDVRGKRFSHLFSLFLPV